MYIRRRLMVTWKDQGSVPQVGDIVLFKNEPIYCHSISAARGSSSPLEKERRCLRSYNLLQERSGWMPTNSRPSSEPAVPVHGSRNDRTSGANPRISRGRSSRNHSSEHRDSEQLKTNSLITRNLSQDSGTKGFLKSCILTS